MSCELQASKCELGLTATRKRKRESGQNETPVKKELPAIETTACFTNSAFSSTPKKLLARRLLNTGNPRSTILPNACLEIKSISDIAQERHAKRNTVKHASANQTENPYEVVRKPPKKKKKHTEPEEVCFENPALNLELPEKQFNPFEVHRSPGRIASPIAKSKCFTNRALNLRGHDLPASRNPFEIQRISAASLSAANPIGVENLAAETVATPPSNLRICLPFTPTLGCRIDFQNMPLSQLTPGKLLAEKLVFSPVLAANSGKKTPQKRSLPSITEESMDIGGELDRYQLELENSINEAKLRKNAVEEEHRLATFPQTLTEIVEQEEEKPEEAVQETSQLPEEQIETNLKQTEIIASAEALPLLSAMAENEPDSPCKAAEDDDANERDDNFDNDTANNDDSELDFKAPAPFVRAYRRGDAPLTVSKESLHSNQLNSNSNNPAPIEPKKSKNVKNLIRNSIRKLIHSNVNEKEKSCDAEQQEKEEAVLTTPSTTTSIMSSIRHSLRRRRNTSKQQQQLLSTADDASASIPEMSIIDGSERTMKLKSGLVQTDYLKIEELTNEKKRSLRSSLRKSTREVRQQFMKTVFHKNQEQYALTK